MNRHARQLFYFGWGGFAPIFNPLAQAVQILAKYGGSLWVASPDYTFTGSDGTGAASDGSDAGYVLDLCGNARPLTQSTTGFKPKLRRVPKRLGAELVTNGTFDADITGWYRAGTTGDGSIGWSAGKLQCARLTADAMAQTTMAGAAAGKQYQVSVTGSGAGFSVGSIDASIRNFADGTVASFTASATSKNLRVWPTNTNSTVLFDNISVREVLEWTWAWVFDGVDDRLATAAFASTTSATIIAAYESDKDTLSVGISAGSSSSVSPYISNRRASGATTAAARDDTGVTTTVIASTPVATGVVAVQSTQLSGGQLRNRVNAVNWASAAHSVATAVDQVGVGALYRQTSGVDFLQGTVVTAAYAPSAIPDAELLIIEKAMAQLAGVTI